MDASGRSDSFCDLRVRRNAEECRLCTRRLFDRELVNIAVHRRRFALEAFIEQAFCNEVVECCELSLIARSELSLIDLKPVERLCRGGLVAGTDPCAPADAADRDEKCDDRDDDHQLDKVESAFITQGTAN